MLKTESRAGAALARLRLPRTVRLTRCLECRRMQLRVHLGLADGTSLPLIIPARSGHPQLELELFLVFP